MIPAIQYRIDIANNGLEQDGGDSDGHRHTIPSSEVAELGELRRVLHIQRAREKLSQELSKMEEAKARAEFLEGQPMIDPQRPYGLPEGEAFQDIWELILDHVNDLEDVARIRDTCVLFRNLLEQTYITLRLSEVGTKFACVSEGSPETLKSLRGVSRSSKTTIDQFFLKDHVSPKWFQEAWSNDDWRFAVPTKPLVTFCTQRNSLHRRMKTYLDSIVRHTVPDGAHHLLLNTVQIIEQRQDVNSPALESLRSLIQRLLEIGGNNIQKFCYACVDDSARTYNRLRNWTALMPNVEELEVIVAGVEGHPLDYYDYGSLEVELQPFPSCPKLRRFSFYRFPASVLFAIFQANPNISEVFSMVFTTHVRIFEDWDDEVEEINLVLRCLNILQIERFVLDWFRGIPPPSVLGFRFGWPLRYLTLTTDADNQWNRDITSRTLFGFVNSFRETLQEITVTWKMRDTGGYLNLPHARGLLWKFWQDFMSFDFIIGLEKLEYLDVDVLSCPEINNSVENARQFVREKNLPYLFPAMKRIRARVESRTKWHDVWKP